MCDDTNTVLSEVMYKRKVNISKKQTNKEIHSDVEVNKNKTDDAEVKNIN